MTAASQAVAPNAVVRVGKTVAIGNDLPIVFIAGPCVLESREHALECAGFLKETFDRLGASFIYKTSFDKANRSSLSGVRGAGLSAALPVFEEIKAKFGVPVLTDVHLPEQCADAASVVDVLQIPAFLCRQTDLLLAAATTGRAINVKKGQFLAPWDMKNVLGKITGAGNGDVLLCERGASFGYNTLVTDFRALPIMKAMGAPVVFDATHSVQQPGGLGDKSGGERKYVPVLARAAASIGVAAIFIETHPDPNNAPSDGPNMVPFAELPALLETVMAFDKLAKSRPLEV
jgi:2-dehydro-3-deoxyphosphooctonate aldolase (KDO 8-P synthase)